MEIVRRKDQNSLGTSEMDESRIRYDSISNDRTQVRFIPRFQGKCVDLHGQRLAQIPLEHLGQTDIVKLDLHDNRIETVSASISSMSKTGCDPSTTTVSGPLEQQAEELATVI